MFAARVVKAADVFEVGHFDRMRPKGFRDTERCDLRTELAREHQTMLDTFVPNSEPSVQNSICLNIAFSSMIQRVGALCADARLRALALMQIKEVLPSLCNRWPSRLLEVC